MSLPRVQSLEEQLREAEMRHQESVEDRVRRHKDQLVCISYSYAACRGQRNYFTYIKPVSELEAATGGCNWRHLIKRGNLCVKVTIPKIIGNIYLLTVVKAF